MSGVLSGDALAFCQTLVEAQLHLSKQLDSKHIGYIQGVLDEINAALAGEALEKVRREREELERIDAEEWQKAMEHLLKKNGC
jgi:hypothetical protein